MPFAKGRDCDRIRLDFCNKRQKNRFETRRCETKIRPKRKLFRKLCRRDFIFEAQSFYVSEPIANKNTENLIVDTLTELQSPERYFKRSVFIADEKGVMKEIIQRTN